MLKIMRPSTYALENYVFVGADNGLLSFGAETLTEPMLDHY